MMTGHKRAARAAARLTLRFRDDTSGNVAIVFALVGVVLMLAIGAAVDVGRWLHARDQTVAAIDAAVLAGGRALQTNSTEAAAIAAAKKYYDENVTSRLALINDTVTFKVAPDGMGMTASGSAAIKTPFLSFANVNSLPLLSTSQTDFGKSQIAVGGNGGQNIEVSLILDITGSMAGQKLTDLKTAAKDLVDIIVWPDQSKHTSKVALVPYSMGVNVGDYADKVRGVPPAPKKITKATKANPVVITAASHGFANNDIVYITGVKGMTQLNDKPYTVKNKTANTFELYSVAVNASSATKINGSSYSTYSSGGDAYCTKDRCEYRQFFNASNPSQSRVFRKSKCVAERTGSAAYTDAAPSTVTALVGTNYPSTDNACPTNEIQPLTSDKQSVLNQITALDDGGSTAGQIGIAWGWYMLSPNFGYLWPPANQPASYSDLTTLNENGQPKLKKIAVIMTDGDFNTPYCTGVISKDALSGSGSDADHINCNATNGDPFAQAKKLCENMDEAGITVYTVGFDVANLAAARDLMNKCATEPTNVYIADDGEELKQAFRDIALKLSSLYLSK